MMSLYTKSESNGIMFTLLPRGTKISDVGLEV
jgi:hypothetical protein